MLDLIDDLPAFDLSLSLEFEHIVFPRNEFDASILHAHRSCKLAVVKRRRRRIFVKVFRGFVFLDQLFIWSGLETTVVHCMIPLDPVLFGVLHTACLLVHDTLHEFCLVKYQHHRPVDVMVCKSNAECHLFGDVVKLDAWFGAAFGHFKMSID